MRDNKLRTMTDSPASFRTASPLNGTTTKSSKMNVMHFVNGDTYTSESTDSIRNGFGIFTWKCGHKYEGMWTNDKRHGEGTMWLMDKSYKGKNGSNLRKSYTGSWKEGNKSGFGSFYFENGDVYEGEWSDDLRHGWGTMVYSNGDRYEGEFVQDQRSGFGTLTKNNMDRHEGQWERDQKNGPGKLYYVTKGQVYIGVWLNSMPKCGQIHAIEDIKNQDSNDGNDSGKENDNDSKNYNANNGNSLPKTPAAQLPPIGLIDSEKLIKDAMNELNNSIIK